MSRSRAARLLAPAKVNLGLRIVGRRADGYHLLDSLFAPLACPGPLCDEVEVALPAPGAGGGVTLEIVGAPPDPVPDDASNLAHRAAVAFLERAGEGGAARVRLRKRIPAGAGLGGGSSDAGATLRLLARLLPGRVGGEALRALALGLGADVPFFLDPRPARVRGIGEQVGPEEPLPGLPLLLLHPGKSLATADVYRAFAGDAAELTAPAPLPTFRALRGPGGRLDREALARLLRNDLEPAATRLCPEIADLRRALAAAGAAGVGMTGSGPVVYGIFEEEHERDEALSQLPGRLTLPPVRAYPARLLGASGAGS